MILSFPFSLGFLVLCVVGSFMSLSSGHWLGVWLGLEVNLLGFIPLMVQDNCGQSVESSVKYFVVQALGSGLILLGGFGMGAGLVSWFGGAHVSLLSILCLFGLFLKLGVAPFHWWVPSVMGGLSWFACSLLVTWQKVAPFFVLLSLSSSWGLLFLVFGGVSAFLGGLMGVGQVQFRFLMAYSSISHWGWITSVACFSSVGGIMYFLFYCGLTLCVFYFLSCCGVWRLNHVFGLGFGFVVIGFLSLAGLPPLSGFVPKWLALQVLLSNSVLLVLGFLIAGSIFSLYYYLSFLFVFYVVILENYILGFKKFFRFFVGLSLGFLSLGLPFYEVLFCFL